MSTAINQLKAAYGIDKQLTHEVTDPQGNLLFTIHFKPLTMVEQDRAKRATEAGPLKDKYVLYLLTQKCLDEHGEPLFSEADVRELEGGVFSHIVDDIAKGVLGKESMLSVAERKSDPEVASAA